MRFRNLNYNSTTSRVSNKVYLSKVQFLDQSSNVLSVLFNRKIGADTIPSLWVEVPQADRNHPMGLAKDAELRIPSPVVVRGAVHQNDRCSVACISVGHGISISGLPFNF